MGLHWHPLPRPDDRLAAGVLDVALKSGDPEWADQLLGRIRRGWADPWGVVDSAGVFLGGLVLLVDGESLCALAAWVEPEHRDRSGELLAAGSEWLVDEARRRGLRRVLFVTSRVGWRRIAPGLGWSPVSETWGRPA